MLEEYLLPIVAVSLLLGGPLLLRGAQHPIVFFFAAIFFTSILKTPELPVVREKFALTEICMLLTWLFWTQIPKASLRRPTDRVVTPLGIAFIVACTLSAVFGILQLKGHHGSLTRVYGAVLVEVLNYAYGVMIVLSTVRLIDRWERLTGAVFAWLAGMAVASVVGTMALAGIAPSFAYEEGTRRICSTLRNENQVPSMILPLITIPIMLAAHRRLNAIPRALMLALTATAFLAALGTGSRTAVLMLIIAAAALIVTLSQDSSSHRLLNLSQLRTLALSFIGALVTYFVIAWAAFDGNYSLVRTPSWQRPAALLIEAYDGKRDLDNTRPRQIRAAIGKFWESPLLGTGPKLGGRKVGEEIHNTYVSLLLETGIVGLLLHVSLIIQATLYCMRAVKRCPYHWYRMMGTGLLIGMPLLFLYNNTMLGLRQRNIWFLIGIMFAFTNLVMLHVPAPIGMRLPRWLRVWRPAIVDGE
ncbi:O-antigen ligase family protein [Novipirellula rosea]|uniref:O-antigen ligase-related domain-containing protein n=1 Tax=Novipirellula rosea TaxID=1031540 RepID=A0ABP8MV98_9BACT